MIWMRRCRLIGRFCSHKIRSNAAGSVHAVVFADSASKYKIRAAA